MNKKNIVLIGFMGTGKTTVGRVLAKKLNWTFRDTDLCIEENTKMKISKIFRIYGEKGFRQLEKDIIRQVSQLQKTVISTGGGIVLDQDNITHLKENGKIYLLSGDINTIISNLQTSRINRPLLKDDDWKKKSQELLDSRIEKYHCSADFIVNINDKSAACIADEILEIHKNAFY